MEMEDKLQYLLEEFRAHKKESNEKLEKILIQTTITNGKVIRLKEFQETAEKQIEALKATANENKGRDKMIGVAMGVVMTIGTAIIVWLITK